MPTRALGLVWVSRSFTHPQAHRPSTSHLTLPRLRARVFASPSTECCPPVRSILYARADDDDGALFLSLGRYIDAKANIGVVTLDNEVSTAWESRLLGTALNTLSGEVTMPGTFRFAMFS